jgi:hypothetical protein
MQLNIREAQISTLSIWLFFYKISHLSIPQFRHELWIAKRPRAQSTEKKLHSTSAAAAAASLLILHGCIKIFFHDKMQQCFLRFHKAFFYEIIGIVQSLFSFPLSMLLSQSFLLCFMQRIFSHVFSCLFLKKWLL